MAKGKKVDEKIPAKISREEMRAAIPKLQKRIEELKQFNIDDITRRGDPMVSAIENKLDATLLEIFGHNTIEYHKYKVYLDHGPIIMGRGPTPVHEAKEYIKEGLHSAIVGLSSLVDIFEEKIYEEPEEPTVRAKRTFQESNIHPEIITGIGQLFQDGHYANAVEDACKILEMFVKMRSMRQDLSGTDLMLQVFSPKYPVLKFNELQSETDISEQQGMMFLYAGAILALRNPRAHSLKVDDPENALDIILFISLLLKSLDNTKRV